MKGLVLALVAGLLAGGEEEKGLRLYQAGEYAEAVTAFRKAIDASGPSAELSYNLALALWKAGLAAEAETAAEQAATLSDGALDPLRDGLLGNLRYDAAGRAAEKDLQGALQLAEQARDHYLRGSLAADAPTELTRNAERALKLIDELKKKIEEQEKKEDENKKDDEKKDDEKKDEEQKDDEKQDKDNEQKDQKDQKDQQEPPEQNDKKDPEQQQDKDDAKPKDEQSDEAKPDESKDQPSKDEQGGQDETKTPPPPPAAQQDKELTDEQKQRLLQALEKLDAQLRELRVQQKARRPKVEKDW